MSKPSNTDLYRKNQVRISVLQQFSTGSHVFVNDRNATMFPTGKQYYDVAAEFGLNMKEPGFYAILNRFIDCGKDTGNNYEVCAVARLADERIARDLSAKLYRDELARFDSGAANHADEQFQAICEHLFNDGPAPSAVKLNSPASVSSPEPTGPLLNENNGMVDVGRILNGQVVSFWVPKPEYVQVAPGVLISRALLEAGCR
jgi:hypothetical protein